MHRLICVCAIRIFHKVDFYIKSGNPVKLTSEGGKYDKFIGRVYGGGDGSGVGVGWVVHV